MYAETLLAVCMYGCCLSTGHSHYITRVVLYPKTKVPFQCLVGWVELQWGKVEGRWRGEEGEGRRERGGGRGEEGERRREREGRKEGEGRRGMWIAK